MSGANIAPASAEDRGARSLDDMDFNDVFDGNRSPGNSPQQASNAAAREVRPDSPEPRRTRQSRRTRATRLPPHLGDALFAHEPHALSPASRRLRAPRTRGPHQRHAWPHRRASPRACAGFRPTPRDPRGATPGRRGAAIGPRVSLPRDRDEDHHRFRFPHQ